jgi:hypothetical protein
MHTDTTHTTHTIERREGGTCTQTQHTPHAHNREEGGREGERDELWVMYSYDPQQYTEKKIKMLYPSKGGEWRSLLT